MRQISQFIIQLIPIFFFASAAFGQPLSDGKTIELFENARKKVCLLKNEEQLVPLKKLDTLRVAFLSYQFEDNSIIPALQVGNDLETMVNKYTSVKTLSADKPMVGEWIKQYDLFIVGLQDGRIDAAGNVTLADDSYYQWLDQLSQQAKVIVVARNAAPNSLKIPPGVQALLMVPPATVWGESVASQIIFGALGARGELTEDFNDEFKKGRTFISVGKIRLAYMPPAVTGMDGFYLADSIKAIVEEGIRAGAFPGAQVLVAKGGAVVYHEAFGYHTYDSTQAVAITDIYDFASVSKVTSALPAVMKLYGEDRFDLDAPFKQYFPYLSHSNKADITYREMLAHFARLRPWIPYWQGTLKGNARYPWQKKWDPLRTNDGRYRSNTFSTEASEAYSVSIVDGLWQHRKYKQKMYKAIKKSPLLEKREYVYSGLLFYLLPEIVGNLEHADYETFLYKNFYHKLGAYTLTYNPLRFFPQAQIVPTERDTFFRHTLLHGTVHDEGAAMMGGVSANAGLFGSANDLAKLFQMYLNEGEYGGERLIAAKALQEFTRCQYCDEGNRRGLGFDKPMIEYDKKASSVAEKASAASFGHSGYTGTFVWADPEQDLIYIFFSNRVYPTRNNGKIYSLNIRPRIHTALYEALDPADKEVSMGNFKPKDLISPQGTSYRLHYSRNDRKSRPGDYVYFHAETTNGERIISASRSAGQKPFYQIPTATDKKPGNPIEDILPELSLGDSITITIALDTLPSKPPGFEDSDFLYFNLTVTDIVGEVEHEQRMAEDRIANAKKKRLLQAREKEVATLTQETLRQYLDGELDDKLKSTDSGLNYYIHEAGNGPIAEAGRTVEVNYYGVLPDGTMFDNSFQRGQPFLFPLGRGRVIEGWDQGFQQLREGDKATLFISSQMAYGERGAPPSIPPNTNLIFYVEVVKVWGLSN
ncbi:MAG: serine hydrolase [Saprospiraceae bacterium]